MPRPRTDTPLVGRTIQLTREQWDAADRAAQAEGLSCSAWLRRRWPDLLRENLTGFPEQRDIRRPPVQPVSEMSDLQGGGG